MRQGELRPLDKIVIIIIDIVIVIIIGNVIMIVIFISHYHRNKTEIIADDLTILTSSSPCSETKRQTTTRVQNCLEITTFKSLIGQGHAFLGDRLKKTVANHLETEPTDVRGG